MSLRHLAAALIDETGPTTFKHMSEIIARRHGFRRTGPQTNSQVMSAVEGVRHNTVEPDDQKLFWPNGVAPTDIIGFRGLAPGGQERGWRDIPWAEMLGLAAEAIGKGGNPVEAMASALGLRRVAAVTRGVFEEAVSEVKR